MKMSQESRGEKKERKRNKEQEAHTDLTQEITYSPEEGKLHPETQMLKSSF